MYFKNLLNNFYIILITNFNINFNIIKVYNNKNI